MGVSVGLLVTDLVSQRIMQAVPSLPRPKVPRYLLSPPFIVGLPLHGFLLFIASYLKAFKVAIIRLVLISELYLIRDFHNRFLSKSGRLH